LEELQQMENADKCAQENFKCIKIIDNKFCVCQCCGAHVLMLPENATTPIKRKVVLQKELEQLREKLRKDKAGEVKLSLRQLQITHGSINWRLSELKKPVRKKVELKKRLPLYRKGELWVCSNCY
jgi:hypothetical protein